MAHQIMHVFEPFPHSFEIMHKEIGNSSNVTCYPCALTTYSGKTLFYVDTNNHGASSIGYPVEWNEIEFDKTPIKVSCTTVDEWSKNNNITHVDFMWLDMEGQGLYALQHSLSILNTVKAIYTEISFVPVRENSCSYYDLRAFLEAQDFREVWKSCDSGRYGDALFIKKNLNK